MTYDIRIKRQKRDSQTSYFQTFRFEGTGEETIAAVLDSFNNKDDLFDVDGNPAPKILWSCSCHQGVCGACSMVINHVPALACKTKLKDLSSNTILLEPLWKFPVVADLMTDRISLYEGGVFNEIWNSDVAVFHPEQFQLQYEASKCMKCGICIEVCPNTEPLGNELGAGFAVDCFLSYLQSGKKEDKKRIRKGYQKHFAGDCSKSMACADHCPAHIDIRAIVNYMNRQ